MVDRPVPERLLAARLSEATQVNHSTRSRLLPARKPETHEDRCVRLRCAARLCFDEAPEHVRCVAHDGPEERTAVHQPQLRHCHNLEDVALLEVHRVNGLRRAREVDPGIPLGLEGGGTTERREEARWELSSPSTEASEGLPCATQPRGVSGASCSGCGRGSHAGRMASSGHQDCSSSCGRHWCRPRAPRRPALAPTPDGRRRRRQGWHCGRRRTPRKHGPCSSASEARETCDCWR